jgi:hypothetical protein
MEFAPYSTAIVNAQVLHQSSRPPPPGSNLSTLCRPIA